MFWTCDIDFKAILFVCVSFSLAMAVSIYFTAKEILEKLWFISAMSIIFFVSFGMMMMIMIFHLSHENTQIFLSSIFSRLYIHTYLFFVVYLYAGLQSVKWMCMRACLCAFFRLSLFISFAIEILVSLALSLPLSVCVLLRMCTTSNRL